jgi:hypothetical protein
MSSVQQSFYSALVLLSSQLMVVMMMTTVMMVMMIVMTTIEELKCYRKICYFNHTCRTLLAPSISHDQYEKLMPNILLHFFFLKLYFMIIITSHRSFTDPRSVLRLQNSDVRTQLQHSLIR